MSLAIIAGSGLSDLAGVIEVERETSFADIPGVGAATIAGHPGRIVTGAIDGRACQLVLGRRHFYEGDSRPIEVLVDHLVAQGATTLLVTSAVGSLQRWLKPGELVVIRDIIDHQNRDSARTRALAGHSQRARAGNARAPAGSVSGRAGGTGRGTPGDERSESFRGWTVTGPASARPLHTDPVATRRFEQAATEAGVAWQPGTMFCASGPLYETLADVAFQQYAGADVAAMSGAPEVAWANRIGLPVVSVTVVTNPCTGIDGSVPAHGEVLEASARAARGLAVVIRNYIAKK